MSTTQERQAEDSYEAQNDMNPEVSADVVDNSYIKSDNSNEPKEVPIVRDNDVDDPDNYPPRNSDADLAQDESEAIDQNNIISDRTRGAKPVGSYSEGPNEDDLPNTLNETGASANAQ